MEKRLRSSLRTSPDAFITTAVKSGFNKSTKPNFKTLIHNIVPSSPLVATLPPSLHRFITLSIASFQTFSEMPPIPSHSPPSKRLRRSSRLAKDTRDCEAEAQQEKHQSSYGQRNSCSLKDLQVLAHIAHLCATHPQQVFSPENLLPGVRELHDNLVLFESDSVLSLEIANLCEDWWKDQLPGREVLISQSFPFLLSRSLTLKKKVDVHRVYALREALSFFDFEDESIEDLKLLLVRCLLTPLYLKTEEGRKFVAYVFGLSDQVMREGLAMIRAQIPFGRKSMLEAYADIVFRAWKVVEEDTKVEIENGFLQGLIEGAIHARSVAFAASIRRVLGGFSNQRTTNGVEKLLFRLAEPVIFRSLQVSNSNVRHNALHLLLDMFPLEDPDATKDVKDTLLDKQFFLLDRLLEDDCPDVRVVAVEGSCRILHLFWEIIPSSTITKTITKIFDEMSHDTCNEVRLSVINGIIYLLGNPQCHELLKVLLPRLGHLILDSALTTRVAVADLLLLLSDTGILQFNKVVGIDVLLLTLANDQPPVAQKVTRLLIPSYFPSKVTLEIACNRCLTLVRRSPEAGARFCEFVSSQGACSQSLMQLVKVFIGSALSSDRPGIKQIEGLIAASACLCNNLANEASHKAALKGLFSGETIKGLIAIATSRRSQSSIFNIVTTVCPDDVGGLFEECMSLVTNCHGLSENIERQDEVRLAHKLMLSCNWFNEMFEVLTGHLLRTANWCHIKFGIEPPKSISFSSKRKKGGSAINTPAKRKQHSGKKAHIIAASASGFEEDFSRAMGIAWQIKDMLVHEGTRKDILASPTLDTVFYALKAISEVSILRFMDSNLVDTSPVLAFSALALHMTLHNVHINGMDSVTKMNGGPCSSECFSKQSAVDQAVDHLFNCTQKLIRALDSGKSASLHSEQKEDGNTGYHHKKKQSQREMRSDTSSPGVNRSDYGKGKRVSNMVKVLTAVLKFVVDANTTGLLHNQDRCLSFASACTDYIILALKQHHEQQLQSKEDDLNETLIYLKSHGTYGAKLLNQVLRDASEASPPPPEAHNFANNLLNLIASTEMYLGFSYASQFVNALKPWLPDLVLALGSGSHDFNTFTEQASIHTSWPLVLARIASSEMRKTRAEEEIDKVSDAEEFPAFRKLVEKMSELLRHSPSVLDAVGLAFFNMSMAGLERKEFDVVLGLLYFVCVKLVGHEQETWGELGMMLTSLHEIYPRLEREIEEGEMSEESRQKLLGARALLEPVWMCYISEAGTFE